MRHHKEKGLHKTFWVIAKKCENKNKFFFYSSGIGTGRVKTRKIHDQFSGIEFEIMMTDSISFCRNYFSKLLYFLFWSSCFSGNIEQSLESFRWWRISMPSFYPPQNISKPEVSLCVQGIWKENIDVKCFNITKVKRKLQEFCYPFPLIVFVMEAKDI